MSRNFKHVVAYLTILALFLSFFLAKEQTAFANDTEFKRYGDFSRYNESNLEFGPSEVYGYAVKTLRKMDVYGNIIWEYTSKNGDFTSNSHRLQNGNFLIGTNDGYVLIFNVTDGALLKSYKVPDSGTITDSFIGANHDVYVIRGKYAFALQEDGTLKWRSDDQVAAKLYYLSDEYFISSTVNEKIAWTNTSDGSVTQDISYHRSLYIDATKKILYITANISGSAYLKAVRLDDGDELWRQKLSNWAYSASVGTDGTIYVGTERNLLALNPSTREVIWTVDTDTTFLKIFLDKQGNIYVSNYDSYHSRRSIINKISPSGKSLSSISFNHNSNNLKMRSDDSFYTIYEGIYYSSSIPAPAITLEQLTASSTSLNLALEESKQINLTAKYSDSKEEDATTKATWKSSNPAVATVTNGKITAVTAGTASITATLDGKTATITVTVTAADVVKVESLIVSPTTLALQEAATKNLTVSAKYSDGATKDVTSQATWKSDKPEIATVNAGSVKAIASGTATITASFAGINQTVAVTVTKEVAPEVEVEFSKQYVFSDLVSNTAEFNSVLTKYTSKELKVIIPEKQFKKITIDHAPNVLTSVALETSRDVRSVKVKIGDQSYDARRLTTTTFEAGIAGLSKGVELLVIGYNASGEELERKVIRLREGQTIIEEKETIVKSGYYALVDLVTQKSFFNQVLSQFSLGELKIGLPVRYIENPVNDIKVSYTSLSTTFAIQTKGTVSKVIIITPDNEQHAAIDSGNGLYKRDISGLTDGDMVTIQVYNDKGNLVQAEPAFVE